MSAELQRLVDYLGSRLGRSVAIDDQHIRLLAYNGHTGDVDAARVGSIMNRAVPTRLSEYLAAIGARQATDLFTVAPIPDVGMTIERIAMPIRYDGQLLGYLWLLGSDGPLDVRDAEAVRDAAGHAGVILHGDFLADEVNRGRERELVRDLLAPDAGLRGEAAEALIEGEFIAAGPVCGLVATFTRRPRGEPLDDQERLALRIAADHGRRRRPPGHAVTLARPDHVLLLATWPRSRTETAEAGAEELASAVHERLAGEVGEAMAARCVVGIGRIQRGLSDAHVSYRQARHATDVAAVTGALGNVVPHIRLGVYALLAKLPQDELTESIHPGIRTLLAPGSGHRDLTDTLEAYLDNAGDAQRTAEHLHIHRATLYYRLRRVGELSGLDLARGDDRLAAHLGLKLARLVPVDPDVYYGQ